MADESFANEVYNMSYAKLAIGHGYYKTHNKFVPTLTGRLAASRQVSLYFLRNEQNQAQDRDNPSAEHDPFKPSAFSRHFFNYFNRIWHGIALDHSVAFGFFQFREFALKSVSLNEPCTFSPFKFDTILRHRCTVEFSDGRRLVVDYGVTLEHRVSVMVMHLMHLRHRHHPRCGATRQPSHDQ